MKTTKRELLDDLTAAVADLYSKSDDYLRNAKSYHCRSNAEIRAGLVKGAAVMRMDANKIQALIDKHKDATPIRSARVEVPQSEPIEPVSGPQSSDDQAQE